MSRVLLFCVVASLCLVARVQASVELQVIDCGSTALKIVSVSQEPDVLKRGRRFTATATAIVTEDIAGATYRLRGTMKLFGRPFSVSFPEANICQLVTEDDCSLTGGRVMTFVFSQVIPSFAPRGRYEATFEVWDYDKHLLTCARFPLDLMKSSSAFLKSVI